MFLGIDDKITTYLSLFICFVRGNDGTNSDIGTFDTYPKISENRVFNQMLCKHFQSHTGIFRVPNEFPIT